MSKQKKGRKHRTVNRTPRPVGRRRPARLLRQQPSAPEPALRPSRQPVEEGTAPVPGSVPGESSDGPVFRNKARDGGLGHHAARTWRELKTHGPTGTTAEDLTASVGYTLPTIRKHLHGLAHFGLAEETGDRWRATARSQWDAAAEHGLPLGAHA